MQTSTAPDSATPNPATPGTPTTTAPAPKKKYFFFKRIFASVRFLLFYVVLAGIAMEALPIKDFILSKAASPWLLVGVIPLFLVLGIFFIFPSRKDSSGVGFVFDIEALIVVVSGLATVIVAGTVALITLAAPTILILGLILSAIYSFYFYRIIKQALYIRTENEKMTERYGELLEVDREKSNFITVTSHQLRTPLTEIRWSLEALLLKKLDSESHQIVQKSSTGINRLVGIVNDMMSAGAVAAVLEKSSFPITPLIETAIQELSALASQKQVQVSFSRPPDDITIQADRDKIKLIVKNIIDNAIRYSPKKSVEISVSTEGENVNIKIKDMGEGIPSEEYDTIFKKFFRGKRALLLEPDGSGVGLYTAQSVIKKHGGKISFVSSPGQGTTFIITLPKEQ